jgi:hypothetical protein
MVQERPFSGNGCFRAGRDRTRVVAGIFEAGRCRYAGVTDPGYNCRCYLALNYVEKGAKSSRRKGRWARQMSS